MTGFRKRVFTADSLWRSFTAMLLSLPWAIRAYLLPGIDTGMAERLLLVVSTVNGCRYCSWAHSQLAIHHAVPVIEVDQLLRGIIPERLAIGDRAALLFALHYAESEGRYTPDQQQGLRRYYSPAQTRGIIALCAAIHFGNLVGNTFDAFLARLRGQADAQGSVIIELLVFVLFAPLLLPLLPLLP